MSPASPDSGGSWSGEMTPAEVEAWERLQERRNRQRRWLRSRGAHVRATDGDPNRRSRRPERMREYRRLYYLRLKAAALGITLAEAARITPRRPRRGGQRLPARDQAGRFLPGPPAGAPTASPQRPPTRGSTPATRQDGP